MKKIERPEGHLSNAVKWKSDIAAEMLRRSKIPYVALNPGASYRGFHDSLVNYLGNENPQMLLCLHEDHVVSIAHGYGKALDEPMACVLHSNVGLMHGLMGIFNAWCDRIPMLIVGATGPVQPEKRRPWIDWIHTAKDQGALLRNYTKWDDEPRSADGIVEAFLRGNQITRTSPKAPVYICLDAGLQEEEAPDNFHIPDAGRYGSARPSGATESDISEIKGLIEKSRKPLFLMGRGSRDLGDWSRRIELAEKAGAYVMTSVRERAIFPTDHALHPAPPLTSLQPEAKPFFEQADLIISFDWADLAGLLKQVERHPDKLPARIVHISQDRALHNGWSMDYFGLPPADISLDANPDTLVTQLVSALGPLHRETWVGMKLPERKAPTYSTQSDTKIVPFDLEVAIAELAAKRPICLAHTNLGWTGRAYQLHGPLDYLGHDGGGGLSAGPGLTIGAALALRDSGRMVVGVLGDGDLMQGITSLWTAAHYSIPALMIVANNRSNFNDEVHQEAMAKVRGRPVENKWIGQRIDDPAVNFVSIANGQGVEGEGPVETIPALMAAIERGLKVVDAGRPYLIDARIVPGTISKIVHRGD